MTTFSQFGLQPVPGQSLRLADAYKQRLRLAKTDNQLNKLYLEITCHYFPRELAEIQRAIALGRVPISVIRVWHRWATKLWKQLLLAPLFPGKPLVGRFLLRLKWELALLIDFVSSSADGVVEWERVPIAGNSFLDRKISGSPDLLVVFPPKGGGLIASYAGFLQAISGAGFDVLKVTPDSNEKSPWMQVTGFSGGFDGFVSTLKNVVREGGYKTVHTLGLSFGCPMALFAGLALRSDSVTTVGLRKAPEDLALQHPDLWRDAVVGGSASGRNPPPVMSFVVGADDEHDVGFAEAMASWFSRSQIVTVVNAPHNPLYTLSDLDLLPNFFDDLKQGFAALAVGSWGNRRVSVSSAGGV